MQITLGVMLDAAAAVEQLLADHQDVFLEQVVVVQQVQLMELQQQEQVVVVQEVVQPQVRLL